MRRHGSAYAASKAAMTHLAEGIRSVVLGTGIRITTIHPGIIRTDANPGLASIPYHSTIAAGVAAIVRAIEREPSEATVPFWPWAGVGFLLRHAPLRVLSKMW
jgi:NAD(P)-dependent dehydrogenase (short-subunit alcohol dehydrogenase family)